LNPEKAQLVHLEVDRQMERLLYGNRNFPSRCDFTKNESVQKATVLVTNHIPENYFIGSKKTLFKTMELYYRQVKNIDPYSILPQTYYISPSSGESKR
jgi:hypothetical protein